MCAQKAARAALRRDTLRDISDMKIALLNTLYAPYQSGGAERSVQILAEGLCRRGLSVSVITLGEPHLEARSVINGVTVYRLPLENWYWPFARRVTNAAATTAWCSPAVGTRHSSSCLPR
jgi:glycosyltransferase involved in cell wall biosynthesis